MSSNEPLNRRDAIAWACIELLASKGARGLNHRAVDQLLRLPNGSTSYYFRTTEALWRAASNWLAMADANDVASHVANGVIDSEGLLELWTSPTARSRLVARFEIYLLAARDKGFRDHIAPHRQKFLDLVTGALAQNGCPNPDIRARDEVATFEGRLLQTAIFASPIGQGTADKNE